MKQRTRRSDISSLYCAVSATSGCGSPTMIAWFFIQLYRWFPSILNVLTVIRPETLVPVASGGFSQLLALEIAFAGRAPANRDESTRADPADEHREPTVGSAAHSW